MFIALDFSVIQLSENRHQMRAVRLFATCTNALTGFGVDSPRLNCRVVIPAIIAEQQVTELTSCLNTIVKIMTIVAL